MIMPITNFGLDMCWTQCRERKNCTWFSYSQSQKLCWLMKDCPRKNNDSGWVSSNSECYDPGSKKFSIHIKKYCIIWKTTPRYMRSCKNKNCLIHKVLEYL